MLMSAMVERQLPILKRKILCAPSLVMLEGFAGDARGIEEILDAGIGVAPGEQELQSRLKQAVFRSMRGAFRALDRSV